MSQTVKSETWVRADPKMNRHHTGNVGQLRKAALNTSVCSSGHLLDSFARAALWDSGLDYLHGTGHGVGCFLNVHEGPCGISYKTFADEPLEAGMIVSDGIKVLSLVW